MHGTVKTTLATKLPPWPRQHGRSKARIILTLLALPKCVNTKVPLVEVAKVVKPLTSPFRLQQKTHNTTRTVVRRQKLM